MMANLRGRSPRRRSLIVHRSVVIGGNKRGVSLEDAFWNAVKEIATSKGVSTSDLISMIEKERFRYGNLSSAIRLFVLDYYRGMAELMRKEK
jgi:predicted DNA-binding ribbon-helix-helix protein